MVSGLVGFAFCGATAYTSEAPACAQVTRIYQTAAPANRASGGGLRVAGAATNGLFGGQKTAWVGAIFTGQVELLNPAGPSSVLDGCFFGAGLIVNGGFNSTSSDPAEQLGSLNAAFPLRIAGAPVTAGLYLRGCRVSTQVIDIQSMGAKPAIAVDGPCDIIIRGAISGATGNTDVGLDLTAARNARIILATVPTVTGTLGNVRLSDGTIITWAVAAAGVIDPAGNVLYASPNAPTKLTAVANGAVASVMTANVGPVGANAAIQRWVRVPDGAGGFFTWPSWT